MSNDRSSPSDDGSAEPASPSLLQRLGADLRRFDAAWTGGGPRPEIEDYLHGYSGPARSEALREFLRVEIYYLHERGDRAAPDGYRARFSGDDRAISDAFGEPPRSGPGLESTSGWPSTPPTGGGIMGSTLESVTRFRVLGLHASGGLGQIIAAVDEEMDRVVALKTPMPDQGALPEGRSRFLSEARVTGRLEHPGIVPIYSLFRDEDGTPFYSMRLVRGRNGHDRAKNLGEAIAEFHEGDRPGRDSTERALALRDLLRRLVAVCDAVAYAHSRGVIHRDLKPANIVLGPFGETLVVDWGLAKVLGGVPGADADDPPAQTTPRDGEGTMPGWVVGTAAYMSPEQSRAETHQLGPESDVYSLGATFYTLLVGRAAFEGRTFEEVVGKVRSGDFPAPRSVRAGVPRPLEAICLKAMAPRPVDRYPTARALADDIERWMADEPVSACREPLARRVRRWVRRRLPLVTAATAALLVSLAFVTLLAIRARDRQRAVGMKVEGELMRIEELALASDPAKLDQAILLAERGRRDLAGDGAHPALERRLVALERSLRDRHLDRRLLASLEVGRLQDRPHPGGRLDPKIRIAAYRKAFADAGVDPERSPEQAADRLRRNLLGVEQAAYIDDWATYAEPAARGRLLAVARRADPDRFRQEIRTSIAEGDVEALVRLAGALDPEAHTPVTLHFLGVALDRLGRPEEAIAWLERSTRQYPGDFWINFTLGNVYADARGDGTESLRCYYAAVALRPESLAAVCNYGGTLLRLGRHAEAEAAYRRAVLSHPDSPDARARLGVALFYQGRHGESAAAFGEAVRLWPDYYEAQMSLGFTLRALGRPGDALAVLRQAADKHPVDGSARRVLGDFLVTEGRLREAEGEFGRAVALAPGDAAARAGLGRALFLQGRYQEAEAEDRRAVALAPGDAAARAGLGNVLGMMGDFPEAEGEYRRAVALAPGDAAARAGLGDVLSRAGKAADAETEFRRALELAPDDFVALNSFGLFLAMQGRYGEAEAALRRAAESDHGDPGQLGRTKRAMAFKTLGDLLNIQGRDDAAEPAFRRAIDLDPLLSAAHVSLGGFLRRRGRLNQAEEALRRGIDLAPRDANARVVLGDVLRRSGRPEAADVEFRQAAELTPDDPAALLYLGCSYSQYGRLDEAERALRRAAELAPGDARNHYFLSGTLQRADRHEGAILFLRRAVELRPDDAVYLTDLARLSLILGRFEESEAAYRRAVARRPGDAGLRRECGGVLERLGRIDEAAHAYRRAIDINPDDALAHCALGLLLQRGGQLVEGLAALERGHRLGSQRPGWSSPSARWVEEGRLLVELDDRLPGLLRGDARPAGAAEALVLAKLCAIRGRHAAAARFAAAAFVAEPALAEDLGRSSRYDAACAAARAGCGMAADAPSPVDPRRARSREQALGWLRADLTRWAGQLEAGADGRRQVAGTMAHWQSDPDLAGLRDPRALSALPSTEQHDWRALWADVASLSRRAATASADPNALPPVQFAP